MEPVPVWDVAFTVVGGVGSPNVDVVVDPLLPQPALFLARTSIWYGSFVRAFVKVNCISAPPCPGGTGKVSPLGPLITTWYSLMASPLSVGGYQRTSMT